MQKSSQDIHPDLAIIQRFAYNPNGLICHHIVPEKESQEYSACDFEINTKRVKFRVAKITPIKIGQFVTFWKRIGAGPIMPYDLTDPFDFLIVNVRKGQQFGQFIFPKAVLLEQGIISHDDHGGKRALRVYPPWDVTDNKQAKNTQAWQIKYFFDMSPESIIETTNLKKLFS